MFIHSSLLIPEACTWIFWNDTSQTPCTRFVHHVFQVHKSAWLLHLFFLFQSHLSWSIVITYVWVTKCNLVLWCSYDCWFKSFWLMVLSFELIHSKWYSNFFIFHCGGKVVKIDVPTILIVSLGLMVLFFHSLYLLLNVALANGDFWLVYAASPLGTNTHGVFFLLDVISMNSWRTSSFQLDNFKWVSFSFNFTSVGFEIC